MKDYSYLGSYLQNYSDMKILSVVIPVIILSSSLIGCERNSENSDYSLKLWYRQPASAWEEALPVGNGRLGAMVFGNPLHERLQLNEESIWAGSKINNNNPDALKTLPELQKALFDSRYKDAWKLAEENFLGTPPNIRSYQPLGDLFIDYEWNSNPENYLRELNLETGIATTKFTIDGKQIIQEVFVSAPDNILVVHITSPDGGLINASFRLIREKDVVVKSVDNNTIHLTGQIIDVEDAKSGPGGAHMRFAGELRLSAVKGKTGALNDILMVRKASEITLRLTAASDYNINLLDFDKSIDPAAICKSILDRTENRSVRELKQKHLEEYQEMFNRVSLSFGKDTLSTKPTDERLAEIKKGRIDNGLIALYFQYGRYLLMCSSRAPAILPSNLQGIWNKDMNAPWNSDFHTNINHQRSLSLLWKNLQCQAL